ncbi:endonuclease/exonuclease/phosphatase family protein [Lacinutrix jangbogonensis]|uniref:endonuclease/exonuclease/phosphatase family protein n=1 Tax=Lacinutrix jangbogonensis TaxID=1469557 RepID=UPI00053D3EDA|nr:endonuclease/exonuclease/phosphatase family protein [Lacinutrix jangbogonensis]
MKLKIMSYNIRHGEGLDTILDLSRAAEIINYFAPDLCALQEVDHFCLRSGSVEQTEYLAKKTETKGTFGAFMPFDGGNYGMATLSAKPIISTKVLELPDGIHEPRSSLIQEIEITKTHSILFANVHLDWISGNEGNISRLNQAKALIAYLNTLDKAVIITGDFNCTPNAPTMQYFAREGFVFAKKSEDNLSFQGKEKAEIDHLIYRENDKLKFKIEKIMLLKEPIASDHRPLAVELSVFIN